MRRVLFVLLLAATTPAAATMDECQELATNIEMTECAWNQYRAADDELNTVWKRVLASIASTEADVIPAAEVKKWRDALITAQRAWVTFKENDCNGAVAYEWYGGTGANAAVGVCLYDHTRARIDDLSARYLNR